MPNSKKVEITLQCGSLDGEKGSELIINSREPDFSRINLSPSEWNRFNLSKGQPGAWPGPGQETWCETPDKLWTFKPAMPKYFIFGGCQENSAARASPSHRHWWCLSALLHQENSATDPSRAPSEAVVQRQPSDKCGLNVSYFENTGERVRVQSTSPVLQTTTKARHE